MKKKEREKERERLKLLFNSKHVQGLDQVPAPTCIIADLNRLFYRCHARESVQDIQRSPTQHHRDIYPGVEDGAVDALVRQL